MQNGLKRLFFMKKKFGSKGKYFNILYGFCLRLPLYLLGFKLFSLKFEDFVLFSLKIWPVLAQKYSRLREAA